MKENERDRGTTIQKIDGSDQIKYTCLPPSEWRNFLTTYKINVDVAIILRNLMTNIVNTTL